MNDTLSQELNPLLERMRESRDPSPVDEATLHAYAETLTPDATSASSLANLFLQQGAVENFKNVMDSGHVRALHYDARNPDPARTVPAMKALSTAMASRRNLKILQLAHVPLLPENETHTAARKALIDALGKCHVNVLKLELNEGSEEFMAALPSEHRFRGLLLRLPGGSAAVAEKCLAKLGSLLESGQITDQLMLMMPAFSEATPEAVSLRQTGFTRLASAIGSRRSLPCLYIQGGIELTLRLLNEMTRENGPRVEIAEFMVANQPDPLQVLQLVDSMTCLLKMNMLTSMQLSLPRLEVLAVAGKKKLLRAAIESTALCDRFTIAGGRLANIGAPYHDVEDASELITVGGRDSTKPDDHELDELIDELAATLQRNRSRALKGTREFVAAAAGSFPFFGSGEERFGHKDIGLAIASALESSPSRFGEAFKQHDFGGLLVNRSIYECARSARSQHCLATLRKLLGDGKPASCRNAIFRLRTLFRANVLMDDDLYQAIREIGQRVDGLKLLDPQVKRDTPRGGPDWRALRWFEDMSNMEAVHQRSRATAWPVNACVDFGALPSRV